MTDPPLRRPRRLRPDLDYFVLGAIAFDVEQYDDIVKHLNDPDSEWRYRFERMVQPVEVLASLMRLVKDGVVEIYVFDSAASDYVHCGVGVWPDRPIPEMFFDMTGRGTIIYLNYDF